MKEPEKNSEIDPHKCGQVIFDKYNEVGEGKFSTNGARPTGRPI